MPEPRDELGTWLGEPVQPLLPPPGTFERVSRRARRLRTRRAVLAAAGALAVTAIAAVAVPQLVIPALGTGRQASATGGLPSATAVTASPPALATAGAPVPAAAAAPPPLSVTFVGAATGWVMGHTIPAGRCDLATAPACIALHRTDSAGAAWRGVSPPPAHGPDGATGVSQIRFLNLSDGWAFGPQLWATHDGGRTWTQIPTHGWRVTALEARGQQVFSVWAQCAGRGAGFASRCTAFAVHSSPAGSDAWKAVLGAAAGSSTARTGTAASLLLTGTTAYLLPPDGIVSSGPLTGTSLRPAAETASPASAPCLPGPAQPDGQPSGALLASASSRLYLLCAGPSAAGQQSKAVYTSANGGHTWQRAGQAPAAGIAFFLSGSPSGALVLATSRGIEFSADGGASWSAAGGTTPPGGFAYAGMTTSAQGVAVPADPSQHAVWFTYDGGSTWRRSPVSG